MTTEMTNDQQNLNDNAKPSVQLNGQYVKKLYFENKNSPASFAPQKDSPKIEISVNFLSNKVHKEQEIYEVMLMTKVNAESTDETKLKLFEIELVYAGLVTLNGIEEDEQMDIILNVHIPTLLFPYAKQIISDASRDGGFQPLMLDPLDFSSLHNQRKSTKTAQEKPTSNLN